MAHNGVLFLDQLPEFNRAAQEGLRQPLESGRAIIARANNHVAYPARVQLVAAMNPCRCGYLDDPSRACGRAPRCAGDCQSKISGPLFDRIDLHVEVPSVTPADLALPPPAEGTDELAARVMAAHGCRILRPPTEGRNIGDAAGQPFPAKVMFAFDPDGQILEVFEPT